GVRRAAADVAGHSPDGADHQCGEPGAPAPIAAVGGLGGGLGRVGLVWRLGRRGGEAAFLAGSIPSHAHPPGRGRRAHPKRRAPYALSRIGSTPPDGRRSAPAPSAFETRARRPYLQDIKPCQTASASPSPPTPWPIWPTRGPRRPTRP